MNWPLLTVVTTNRNYGRFLAAAIESVLAQDYPNLEYMVLDAGSTDDWVAVIQRYAARLAYWHSVPDNGPVFGLNFGLRRARGEWFHYLNSDDFLLPGALRRFAAVAQAGGPRLWISGGRHEVDAAGRFQRAVIPWRSDTHLFPLRRMWHAAEGTFLHLPSLRRHALEFDETYQNIFDTVLYTKLERLAPPLYADAFFGSMRLHGANLSGPANSASVARRRRQVRPRVRNRPAVGPDGEPRVHDAVRARSGGDAGRRLSLRPARPPAAARGGRAAHRRVVPGDPLAPGPARPAPSAVNLLFLEQQPRFIGGSERMSLALCRHAVARGHRTFLAYSEPGDMVEAYANSGAQVRQREIRPLAVRRPLRCVQSLRGLIRLVQHDGIDWVFTSQVSYVSLLAAVGRLTRARAAVHLGLVYDFPSPLFRLGRRHIQLGVAPSAHAAAAWRQRGWPASSLAVIPNGVDTTVFNGSVTRDGSRHVLGLPPAAQPLVAYVGRLVAEKGIFTLLRAYAAWRRTSVGGLLLLAGHASGGEVAALRRLATELHLPDDTWQVRPPTSRPEEIYRAADVVVVPSEWDEPFGLAPLEAMACGTMALVSDRGVLPDFVAVLGRECVFPAGAADALASRLTHWLAEAPRREQAAAQLAAHTRNQHAFARCGDAYLAAFAAPNRR